MEKLENWHADIVAKEESGSQLSVVSLFSHLKILLSPASIWGYLLNLFPHKYLGVDLFLECSFLGFIFGFFPGFFVIIEEYMPN